MSRSPPKIDYGSIKQRGHAFDNVAVRHRNTNERDSGRRWRAAKKSPLAFEDADEPMEFFLVYTG
jgi:hypothetical protein